MGKRSGARRGTMAGETAPGVSDAYYAVVVYGIPLSRHWNQANELKDMAYLNRNQKKNLKPSRVEILRGEDDDLATVVYLFRRSVEITRKDQSVVIRGADRPAFCGAALQYRGDAVHGQARAVVCRLLSGAKFVF